MATTAISVEQYLKTSFDGPDCDYVDGEVVERNLGEKEHSLLQIWIGGWFLSHRREWNIIPLTEQRVQVGLKNFRVPDVCVVAREDDFTRIVRKPPVICVEILSPEDTVSSMMLRLEDYRQFGVENIWLLDPGTRMAWVYEDGNLNTAPMDALRAKGSDMYLPLEELWAELD